MEELLTAGEVADRLRLKPSTILRWVRRGRLPAIRLGKGKGVRFEWDEVVRALHEEAKQNVGREESFLA